MKTELRLHRESCFQVELKVLLMELLACHMYLSVKECIQFYDFETSNYGGVRDSLSSRMPHPTPLRWRLRDMKAVCSSIRVREKLCVEALFVLTFVRPF